MSTLIRVSVNIRFYIILLIVGTLSLSIFAPANSSSNYAPESWPPDLINDIPRSIDFSNVADIQAAFNYGRTQENAQLGTNLPSISLPSQIVWDSMTENDRALWLINSERQVRNVTGMHPLHGWEGNVISVAQKYAEFLRTNDKFGHYEDGYDPEWRLDQNKHIKNCSYDPIPLGEYFYFESIWAHMATYTIKYPVEQAIYDWIYEDKKDSWGHRRMMLWFAYIDNSGLMGKEGFIGIGHASGSYMGYPNGEVIVMNVFDPCANWIYPPKPATFNKISPSDGTENQSTSETLKLEFQFSVIISHVLY